MIVISDLTTFCPVIFLEAINEDTSEAKQNRSNTGNTLFILIISSIGTSVDATGGIKETFKDLRIKVISNRIGTAIAQPRIPMIKPSRQNK